MLDPEEADRFERLLRTRVRSAIEYGATSYAALLRELGDVYPSVMLMTLRHLAAAGELDVGIVDNIESTSRRPCAVRLESTPTWSLAVPHPLDFDWRFSMSALQRLENEPGLTDSARLICLGAPSFYSYVKGLTPGTVQLLDASPEGASDAPMGRIQLDLLRDELPCFRADAIVADPPWYPEHMRAFLWAARELCEKRGRVWLSAPGAGTRPGIEGERAELVSWARSLGLRLVKQRGGALPYLTPPFERNALRAEGIECVPAQWRHGDLLVFDVAQKNTRARPSVCSQGVIAWEEVRVGQVRMRFRAWVTPRREERVDPRPRQLVSGDVLPSVSRRAPPRAHAQIWTSGNRVFECDSPMIACEIARAAVLGVEATERVEEYLGRDLAPREKSHTSEADAHLRRLVEIENREYGLEWGRA